MKLLNIYIFFIIFYLILGTILKYLSILAKWESVFYPILASIGGLIIYIFIVALLINIKDE